MGDRIPCVGIHSLFAEPDRVGTDRERHAVLGDLDDKRALREPAAFRKDVRRAMRAHGIPSIYVLESRKGVQLFSPWLQSRRHTERFEEALEEWGSDGFHRIMGWRNGGTVLRVTPKPGEGEKCLCPLDTLSCPRCFDVGWTGQRFICAIVEPDAIAPWSYWSIDHWTFMRDRFGLQPAPEPSDRGVTGGGVRLEHYWTPQPQAVLS